MHRRCSFEDVHLVDVLRVVFVDVCALARQMLILCFSGTTPPIRVPVKQVVVHVAVELFGCLPMFLGLVAPIAAVAVTHMVLQISLWWVGVGCACVVFVKCGV